MKYEALPFRLTPERAEIISLLLRRVAAHDTIFARTSCAARCVETKDQLPAMCRACQERMRIVSAAFSSPDARVYEIWGDTDLVGVVHFSRVRPGLDAIAHYVFWDGKSLGTKTKVIEEVFQEVFGEFDLKRLTAEIPAVFPTIIKHATKKLGFGGYFQYTLREGDERRKPKRVRVEGVKRNAVVWRDHEVDLVTLGRVRNVGVRNGREQSRPAAETQTAQASTLG